MGDYDERSQGCTLDVSRYPRIYLFLMTSPTSLLRLFSKYLQLHKCMKIKYQSMSFSILQLFCVQIEWPLKRALAKVANLCVRPTRSRLIQLREANVWIRLKIKQRSVSMLKIDLCFVKRESLINVEMQLKSTALNFLIKCHIFLAKILV